MNTDVSDHSSFGCPITLPAASLASRKIATKSRCSVRGFVVATFPDEPDGRRVYFESGLERDFVLLMLARRGATSRRSSSRRSTSRGSTGKGDP